MKNSIARHYNSVNFEKGGLTRNISETDTLLSKILLGTMACVPAYDRFFVAGMIANKMNKCRFDADSLEQLFDFISANERLIKKSQQIAKQKTNYDYPVMKIIDMYFWQIGYDSNFKDCK